MKLPHRGIVIGVVVLLSSLGAILALILIPTRTKKSALPPPDDRKGFFEVARLLPFAVLESDVYHHRHIVSLGRALDSDAVLPRYFKYREGLLVPVRTQGKCASCWAFAVADMLGDRVSLHTRGMMRENRSVQELVACLSPLLFSCDRGGVPEMTYSFIARRGLLTEDAYPYAQMTESSIEPCQTRSVSLLDMVWSDPQRHENHPERHFTEPGSERNLCIDPGRRPSVSDTDAYEAWQEQVRQNVQNMKSEIFLHGPIVGTLMVYEDLYTYNGDSIYRVGPNSRLRGGHAIEIFGWSDEGQNTEEKGFEGAYWICRNSWGHIWPRQLPAHNSGWFYVRMGTNEAGIESRASCARPMLTRAMRAPATASSWLTTAYASYDEYVRDPERQNFFSHLRERRLEGKATTTATASTTL